MAEGIQLASFNSKYYCHHCSREVSPYHTAELICPDCSSDFLEEVSKDVYEAEYVTPICEEYGYGSDDDNDEDDLAFMPEIRMDNLISQMLMNVADNPESRTSEASTLQQEEPLEGVMLRPASITDLIRNVSMGSYLSEDDIDPSEVAIYRFLEDGSGDEVDALAAQLFDEVEISGPPPLTKEQIKALSTVTVTKECVEKGLQCTVCMDDFNLKEKLKSLPCNHMYHEKCITPWLERQGTCPNCRDVIQVQVKTKRSRSCSRARMTSRGNDRRLGEPQTLGDFFTASLNPFRFLN